MRLAYASLFNQPRSGRPAPRWQRGALLVRPFHTFTAVDVPGVVDLGHLEGDAGVIFFFGGLVICGANYRSGAPHFHCVAFTACTGHDCMKNTPAIIIAIIPINVIIVIVVLKQLHIIS